MDAVRSMRTVTTKSAQELRARQRSPLATPTDLAPEATRDHHGHAETAGTL